MTSTAYSVAFTKESTNCITPSSALARSMDLLMIFRNNFISLAPIRKKIAARKMRSPRFRAFSGRVLRNF